MKSAPCIAPVLVAVLVAVLGACGKSDSGSRPAASEREPPPKTDSPAAAKTPAAPAALASVALPKLGLTVQAPACAQVRTDDTYKMVTLSPTDPSCAIPLMGIRIEIPEGTLTSEQAKADLERFKKATDAVVTPTPGGWRIDYTATRGKGYQLATKIADALVVCSGEHTDVEVVRTVCNSLAKSP